MNQLSPILVTGQWGRIATINFDFASLPALKQYVLSLPEDSIIFDGFFVITKPFNTAGTDTLAFGTTALPNRNLAPTNLKVAAVTALTSTTIANGDMLRFLRATGAGAAATVGAGYLMIRFAAPRINDFNVGDVWEPAAQRLSGDLA